MSDSPRCEALGCDKPRRRGRLCGAHAHKKARYGDPNVSVRPLLEGSTPEERLALNSAPNPETGCIEWTAGANAKGYGLVRHEGKVWLAHRLALHLAGQDVQGKVVRHLVCDNPPCINPEHLATGTRAENNADRYRKERGLRGTTMAGRHALYVEHEIRSLTERGVPMRLAEKSGLHHTTIRNYVRRGRAGTLLTTTD